MAKMAFQHQAGTAMECLSVSILWFVLRFQLIDAINPTFLFDTNGNSRQNNLISVLFINFVRLFVTDPDRSAQRDGLRCRG